MGLVNDDTELFKQFMDNESFKRWLTDTVFALTFEQPHPRSPRVYRHHCPCARMCDRFRI